MRNPTVGKGLPPLNALCAFEAAGRHESIRKAAAELGVTPGAVSRQVRMLEAWLGVELFRRIGQSVSLTTSGAGYHAQISEHLGAIAEATLDVMPALPDSGLQVRTWTMFSNWLVPRLADFQTAHPWVDLQLLASSQRSDFGHEDVDIEILGYDETLNIAARVDHDLQVRTTAETTYEAFFVLRSQVVCVCSKQYADEHDLHDRADLARLGAGELLHSMTAPDLWDHWLQAAGIEGLNSRLGRMFGDSALAVGAARGGLGVALVPRKVFEWDLETGQLIVPFDGDDVEHYFSFYAVCSAKRSDSPPVAAFRNWLWQQASSGGSGPVLIRPSAEGAARVR